MLTVRYHGGENIVDHPRQLPRLDRLAQQPREAPTCISGEALRRLGDAQDAQRMPRYVADHGERLPGIVIPGGMATRSTVKRMTARSDRASA